MDKFKETNNKLATSLDYNAKCCKRVKRRWQENKKICKKKAKRKIKKRGRKMKGYELIKEIQDGNIDDCDIKWKSPKGEGIVEVRNRTLQWEPGTFSTLILTSSFAEFELIEENKEIEEMKNTLNKLNELFDKAYNKLIKERETE